MSATSSDHDHHSECSDVQVDFSFSEFQQIHFHGLKNLLNELLSTVSLNTSELAELVISQPFGSAVLVDDSADPFAFISAVKSAELEMHLLQCAKSSESKLAEIFKGNACVLLTNRLINMPPELAPNMYKTLLDELAAAAKTDQKFKFDHYILISKVYRQVPAKTEGERPSKKAKHELFYFQAEDEYIESHSEFFIDYSLSKKQTQGSKALFSDFGVDSSRRLMVLNAKAMPKMLEHITKLFS